MRFTLLFYIFIFCDNGLFHGKMLVGLDVDVSSHCTAGPGCVINKSMWTGRLISCWTMYIYNINMDAMRGEFSEFIAPSLSFLFRRIKGDKIV